MALRLTPSQIKRIKGLMHMWYTPNELGQEVGITAQWIRRKAIPAGMPHRLDDTGHIWIDGEAFQVWVQRHCIRRRVKLPPGQAWCMRCGCGVEVDNQVVTHRPLMDMVKGTCRQCGGAVSFARRKSDGQSG